MKNLTRSAVTCLVSVAALAPASVAVAAPAEPAVQASVSAAPAPDGQAAVAAALDIVSDRTYAVGKKLRIDGTATPGAHVHIEVRTGTFVVDEFPRADRDGKFSFESARNVVVFGDAPITVTLSQSSDDYLERVPFAFRSEAERIPTQPVEVTSERSYTRGDRLRVEGSATPKAVLTYRFELVEGLPTRERTVDVDAAGRFSFETEQPVFADGTVEAHIDQRRADAEPVTVTFDNSGNTPRLATETTEFVKGQGQRITGTSTPNQRVDVFDGAALVANTTADANGDWAFLTDGAITGDTFTRTLRTAGQADTTFTLTATGATAPIEVTSRRTYVQGEALRITGTAAASSTLYPYLDGEPLTPFIRVGGDGGWELRADGPAHRESFTLTLASSSGGTARSFTFTADTDAPATPVTIDGDRTYEKGADLAVTGTGPRDDSLNARLDGKTITPIQVGSDGSWKLVTSATKNDSFTLELAASSNGAHVEATFTGRAAWVDASLTSHEGVYEPGANRFSGTGTPGAKITATTAWNTVFGTATVNDEGTWAFDRAVGPTATYVLGFTATKGAASNTWTSRISPALTMADPGAGYTPGQTHVFTGTATPGATIAIKGNPAWTIATVKADSNGNWTLKRAWGPTAVYTLSIHQTVNGAEIDSMRHTWKPVA